MGIEINGNESWRRIAWNGVRFSAPVQWEIGRIGLRYLEFEDETGPVMEVKWNRVKGRFSHKAHLRRLAGLQKQSLKKSFQPIALPEAWKQALGGYDVRGFSWQSESVGGKGVLIYDPSSRFATLIQFYRQNTTVAEHTAARLLASYRDQIAGNYTHWEVFDIHAEIPVAFVLQQFRFEAGQYEMKFSTRHHQLQMIRWSPAAILLRRRDLSTMAQDSFLPKVKQPPQWLQSNDRVVEGQVLPSSALARVAGRIRRRPAHRIFRLWHEIEKNRILGVQISGANPIERRQFSAICEKYETV